MQKKKFTHNMVTQGLKSLNKAARDLIQMLQKVDGDNYPEVLFSPFQSSWLSHSLTG